MFTEVVEKLLCYSHVYRGCREVAVLVMLTEVVEKLLCYSHVYRGCREVAVLQSRLQRL